MTDRISLDLSLIGKAGYLVKVDDRVPTREEFERSIAYGNYGDYSTDNDVAEMFPGSLSILGGEISIVYDADIISQALGLPSGYFTTGTYFITVPDNSYYIARLVIQDKVQTLDEKYLPEHIREAIPRYIPPKFEITWDGDMTDREVIDGSQIGFDVGTYFVKVSDDVYMDDELAGGRIEYMCADGTTEDTNIDYGILDTTTYPGGIKIETGAIIIYDADRISAALGAPEGYITNGVYFTYIVDSIYTETLTGPYEYIPLADVFISDNIPRFDDVYDIINNAIEVAIGNAIGGSY